MAKFEEVYEETIDVFKTHITKSNIPSFIKIKLLSNNTLKDFGSVTKSQDIIKFMTDYDVIIQINEPIFDQLQEDQKEYVVKDLLAHVVYDMEKDKLSIAQPDVTTFSGVLRQYDIDMYIGIKESIVTLLEEKKIQEDLAKQATKTNKVRI
tara:strand:- start:4091 stop:4543 length:453 start_codon:yes stop_codon:yes gene_type:complete